MPKKILNITYYSAQEVANILGITRRSVYEYLKTKKLIGSKIGNRWHFTEKQIKDLISKGTE